GGVEGVQGVTRINAGVVPAAKPSQIEGDGVLPGYQGQPAAVHRRLDDVGVVSLNVLAHDPSVGWLLDGVLDPVHDQPLEGTVVHQPLPVAALYIQVFDQRPAQQRLGLDQPAPQGAFGAVLLVEADGKGAVDAGGQNLGH